MGSCRTRSALLLCLLSALLVTTLATSANPQGLPGLPSFGVFRGPVACGEKGGPSAFTDFYVGWMWGPSVSNSSTTDGAVDTQIDLDDKHWGSGVWLGLTERIGLNERFGLIASGWYLIPYTT
ncbi:MAG: hypothetical protein ACLP5H_00620 [Desulfomonilaceae bacterium]